MYDTKALDIIPELELQRITEEDHDTECAMKAGELIELGFMGQEFACYGIGYVKENKIQYFICDQENTMLLFLQECFDSGYLTTSILYEVQRFQVPVGQHDFFKRKIRQQTAQKLKARYGTTYFRAIHVCGNETYFSDTAWPLLQNLCGTLRNALNHHVVQIVVGLARDAYEMRKLNQEQYQQICAWRTIECRNFAEEYIIGQRYSRTYYGFCSYKDGKLQYYSNASLFAVEQKRRERISNGEVISPILNEFYTADHQMKLQEYRNDFMALLKIYFTESFMISLQELWKLPSGVDTLNYREYASKIQQEGCAAAMKEFAYYGYLWNMM